MKYSDFLKASDLMEIKKFRVGVFVDGKWIDKESNNIEGFKIDTEELIKIIIVDEGRIAK